MSPRHLDSPVEPPADKGPVCPVCENPCCYFYTKEDDGSIIGCEHCIERQDAQDYLDGMLKYEGGYYG